MSRGAARSSTICIALPAAKGAYIRCAFALVTTGRTGARFAVPRVVAPLEQKGLDICEQHETAERLCTGPPSECRLAHGRQWRSECKRLWRLRRCACTWATPRPLSTLWISKLPSDLTMLPDTGAGIGRPKFMARLVCADWVSVARTWVVSPSRVVFVCPS